MKNRLVITNYSIWPNYGHSFFNVSTPFPLVMAAAAADAPKSCFYAAKNRVASSLGVGATSFYICQMHVKTLMGLELFEVRFFFVEKFTKFDLALSQDIKNHSKVIKRISAVLFTILTKTFFFVKSLMGTPLDSFFFHKTFFSS